MTKSGLLPSFVSRFYKLLCVERYLYYISGEALLNTACYNCIHSLFSPLLFNEYFSFGVKILLPIYHLSFARTLKEFNSFLLILSFIRIGTHCFRTDNKTERHIDLLLLPPPLLLWSLYCLWEFGTYHRLLRFIIIDESHLT